MSGEAMMQDSNKHIYHSITMETPGTVTMTEGPRCCAGGRKVMTLLLASALLWVIVLDIILVVYKSHHLGVSVQKAQLSPPMLGRVVMLRAGAMPSVDGGGNSSFSSPPPPALPENTTSAGQSAEQPRQSTGGPGQSPESAKMNAGIVKSGRSGAAPLGLQGWLSRLRHRPIVQSTVTSLGHSGEPPHWPRPNPLPTGRLGPWAAGHSSDSVLLRHELGFPVDGSRPRFFGRPETAPKSPPTFGSQNGVDSHPPEHGGLPATRSHPGLASPGGVGSPEGVGSRPERRSADSSSSSSSEQSFLVRFFSAVMDAPWNLTSAGGGRRRRPLLPPPPPAAFFPGGRFWSAPGRSGLAPSSITRAADGDDAEETIFDIDITD